jgi:acyl carrier protein
MKLFRWFQRTRRQGIRAGEEATRWASTRFAPHLQPIAAYVADLLCLQIGVDLHVVEATSTFTVDLRMDDLEPVEFVMALEEELGIKIPDEDCTRLDTVSALVSYLDERLSSNARNA